MLVLDKSGSMVSDPNGHWDHDGDDADDDGIQDADEMSPSTPKRTRWKSLYEAVQSMSAFEGSMHLGMALFPSKLATSSYNESACPVSATPEVSIAPTNGMAVLSAMPGPDANDTIKGGTPAARGIKAALSELATVQDGQPRFIILVIDGAANCVEDALDNTTRFEVYDDTLHTLVGEAYTIADIRTYVVGIAIKDEVSPMVNDGNPDDINTHTKLNELAELGGRPLPGPTKFYDTQDQIELETALDQISWQMKILSCTVTLAPAVEHPHYLAVEVGDVEYGSDQVMLCNESEDGWMYTSGEMNEIVLCGKACSDFQTSGSLRARYRCPS